jgi:hypothetical protein
MGDDLAVLAIDLCIDERIDPDLVVVKKIARRVLEVPLHLAGFDVVGDRGVSEQVIARAVLRIEHGNRLARTPYGQIEGWVIRACLPESAPAVLPGVGVALPGFATRLARRRNRIRPPELLAGIRIQGIDMVASAPVPAAAADDELVADNERSTGQGVAVLWIINLNRLDQLTRVAVRPEHLTVAGYRDDEILVQRNSPVCRNKNLGLRDTWIH